MIYSTVKRGALVSKIVELFTCPLYYYHLNTFAADVVCKRDQRFKPTVGPTPDSSRKMVRVKSYTLLRSNFWYPFFNFFVKSISRNFREIDFSSRKVYSMYVQNKYTQNVN